MNKVVIMLFVIIVGGVLIGVPLWGFFHPQVMPEYDKISQNVNAAPDSASITLAFNNTVWTTSHNVNIDDGYGHLIPVTFELEFHFYPGEKLMSKAHLFSDVDLPQHYQALKPSLEAGWEGKWRVLENGSFIRIESANPFVGYKEIEGFSPFRLENIKIEGELLVYSPTGQEQYQFKKFL